MAEVSRERVLAALRNVLDPELWINVIDLGLVYAIEVEEGHVRVAMTMTTPACPISSFLSQAATNAIWKESPEAQSVQVELVWAPAWNATMMSPEARRQMGWRE